MKMPEKHDLLAAILAAKEQGIGATSRSYGVLAADNGGVYKNSNRRNDVRHYRLVQKISTSLTEVAIPAI